jgi:hypothetical protein
MTGLLTSGMAHLHVYVFVWVWVWVCACVCAATLSWATQVHIMLTNDPTEMRVMWITSSAYDNNGAPLAEIGTVNGTYGSPIPGVSTTYTVPPRWWGGFTGTIQNVW